MRNRARATRAGPGGHTGALRSPVRPQWRVYAVLTVAALSIAGCEGLYLKPYLFDQSVIVGNPPEADPEEVAIARPLPPEDATAAQGEDQEPVRESIYSPGTEQFVRGKPRSRTVTSPTSDEGEFTLNFEDTNILQVVKVILGDLLQENYRVAAGVQGTVTLQTSRPVPSSALLGILEMLLRSNNAALVKNADLYHVVPQEAALKGLVVPSLGDRSLKVPPGYAVRIVPLRFIAAQEMFKILEPFAGPTNVVRVDSPRNLMVLAGSAAELSRLIETIEVFDVDWLAGMSVAVFTPSFVDAQTLAGELRQVLDTDDNGALAGLVRIVELERLNSIMVITPRRTYLERISDWVERLDQDSGGVGQRLYVYHVQNGRASELADVLSQVFDAETGIVAPAARVAPGLEPAQLDSAEQPSITPDGGTAGVPPGGRVGDARRSSGADEGLTLSAANTIRIIADEINNALLIKATAQEYQLVEAALRRLDIVPLQVLIEATIAEITLTDELALGLEWFFKNSFGSSSKEGRATLDLGAAGLAAVAPGFSYAITDAAGVVRAVLNTLASESKVNILSSPSLMVLNNQTATINVGDEVPITTQQQQSTAANANVINTIEFRDTGVLLTVTPRVNASGLVTMEIEQEVSNVAAGTGGNLTPTIQQRRISSTVAVSNAETVVLGGLIRETTSFQKSGLPVLHELPVVGALFGRTGQDQRRTELVVLITPRVVQSIEGARRVTDEFRRKMESLRPLQHSAEPPPPGRSSSGPSRPATVTPASRS